MKTHSWKARTFVSITLVAVVALISTVDRTGASNGYDVTYTLDADFDGGTLFNVNHTSPNNDQLQLNEVLTTFPLMWVANAGEDTVSKIDTSANKETGRYRTWFNSGFHGSWTGPAPSRTAVDSDGNAYVLNRHFGACEFCNTSNPASLMKVLSSGYIDRNGDGDMDTAVDSNNDGVVSLSETMPIVDFNGNGRPDSDSNGDSVPDAGEIKDERIVWIVPVGIPNALGRAVCIGTDGSPWVGNYNERKFYKINATTGASISSVTTNGGTPYGCAIDSNGMLWMASIDRYITKIDTNTNTWLANPYHGGSVNYGITVGNGKVYFSAHEGGAVYRTFDPATNTFASGGPGDSVTVSINASGDIYAGGLDGSIRKFNSAGVEDVAFGGAPSAGSLDSRGTIIDSDGNVWRIHRNNSTIAKYDGGTGALLLVRPVGSLPYTYSDASGLSALTNTTPTGSWTVIQDSGANGTIWETISWNGSTPSTSTITVRADASDSLAALSGTPSGPVTNGGAPAGTGRYIKVQVTLTAASNGTSPVLNDIRVTGRSPNQAPTASCHDVTVGTGPAACTASASIDNGSSDPDGDTLTSSQEPATFSLGTSSATLTVRDPLGLEASCSANVTVVDDAPPSIACPAPTTLECTGPNTPFSPAAATAADNCSVTVTNPAPGTFPIGTTVLSYSAADGAGASASCSSAVTVVDTTGPVITGVTNSFATVWPPNHNMVPLNLTVTATDSCVGGPITDTASACRVTNITSNEAINATGDGDTDPDWIVPATGLNASIRAERRGNGTGRIYTVTVVCTDAAGNNSAPATTTVAVPQSQGRR